MTTESQKGRRKQDQSDQYHRLRQLVDQESWDEALSEARALLVRNPNDAGLHFVSGLVLRELGHFREAREHLLVAALEIEDEPELFGSLGRVEVLLGDTVAARAAFERAMSLLSSAERIRALGLALANEGFRTQAIDVLERAFQLGPSDGDLAYAIAQQYRGSGAWQQALEWSMKALGLKQDLYWDAGLTLAASLVELKRYGEALDAYESLSYLRPKEALIYRHLGTICSRLGIRERAARYLLQATEIEPERLETACDLVHQQMFLNDWTNLEERCDSILSRLRESGQVLAPFTVLSLPGATAQDIRECAKRWMAQPAYSVPLNLQGVRHRFGEEDAERPLRVGYLTNDFHEHATAFLAARLFELHDRDRFRVHAYHWDTTPADAMRHRLEAAFHVVRDISGLSDDHAARLIHGDQIDILVDLKAHTSSGRLEIAARRPAPVQMHHLGYPASTGASFIDYFVADRFVVPPGRETDFVETLAFLPDCYQPTDSTRPIGPRPSRAECGLPEQGTVYCCFNQTYKITPDVFARWCQILQSVPDSVLWLLVGADSTPSALRAEAQKRGVRPERLVFGYLARQEAHLARLQNADVFLDTLPYNAHTTASDALWAGVPVVTLPGTPFVSRVAGSIVSAMGLPELIASSPEDYVNIAVRIATEPGRLANLKERIERGRKSAPLFDSERYTRNLAKLYRAVWRRCVQGLAPGVVTVEG